MIGHTVKLLFEWHATFPTLYGRQLFRPAIVGRYVWRCFTRYLSRISLQRGIGHSRRQNPLPENVRDTHLSKCVASIVTGTTYRAIAVLERPPSLV